MELDSNVTEVIEPWDIEAHLAKHDLLSIKKESDVFQDMVIFQREAFIQSFAADAAELSTSQRNFLHKNFQWMLAGTAVDTKCGNENFSYSLVEQEISKPGDSLQSALLVAHFSIKDRVQTLLEMGEGISSTLHSFLSKSPYNLEILDAWLATNQGTPEAEILGRVINEPVFELKQKYRDLVEAALHTIRESQRCYFVEQSINQKLDSDYDIDQWMRFVKQLIPEDHSAYLVENILSSTWPDELEAAFQDWFLDTFQDIREINTRTRKPLVDFQMPELESTFCRLNSWRSNIDKEPVIDRSLMLRELWEVMRSKQDVKHSISFLRGSEITDKPDSFIKSITDYSKRFASEKDTMSQLLDALTLLQANPTGIGTTTLNGFTVLLNGAKHTDRPLAIRRFDPGHYKGISWNPSIRRTRFLYVIAEDKDSRPTVAIKSIMHHTEYDKFIRNSNNV